MWTVSVRDFTSADGCLNPRFSHKLSSVNLNKLFSAYSPNSIICSMETPTAQIPNIAVRTNEYGPGQRRAYSQTLRCSPVSGVPRDVRRKVD